MDVFDSDELAAMQSAQEAAMMDTCTLLKYVDGATDEYGMPLPAWVEGPVLACGYDGRRQVETGAPGGTAETQVELTDGRIRLPIDTEISNLDRVRVTHRFGVLLDAPLEYELSGAPRRGPSGLLIDLKLAV